MSVYVFERVCCDGMFVRVSLSSKSEGPTRAILPAIFELFLKIGLFLAFKLHSFCNTCSLSTFFDSLEQKDVPRPDYFFEKVSEFD